MSAVRMWLGLDLRRRSRSLVALALLIALASGTVMAALAGARRADTSVERLQAVTKPATVAVLPNTPNFDWDAVQKLPQVEALSRIVIDYAIEVDGVKADSLSFPPADDQVRNTLETPVLFEGRLLNPQRADEVMVSPEFVHQYHRGVGDTVTVRLPTPQELVAGGPEGAGAATFHGPVVRARIVGVGKSPWFLDQPGGQGVLTFSPALARTYPDNVIGDQEQGGNFVNALVRVKGGEAGIPAFQKAFEQLEGRSDVDFMNLGQQADTYRRTVVFEAQCLAAFALAVLAAALFLVGQAVVRYAAGGTADLSTMRALGMTPRQAALAATAGPALAAVLGAVLGVAGAIAASPLFPIGTAGFVEPDPGLSVDPLVLAGIAALTVVLTVTGSFVSAWTALAAARADRPPRRSLVALTAQRVGLGVPFLIGTRFALEPGRGRTAVPVRPALLGAVVGVLGVVGAFTFSHGVSDAAANPIRFGQTFQFTGYVGFNGYDFGPAATLVKSALAQREVTGVDDSRSAVATGDGNATATLYEYAPSAKPLPTVITQGRMVRHDDEIVLGPQTLTAMHRSVGDTVRLSGSRGPDTLKIVGAGLFPEGPHNGYADGGWVTPRGYDTLFKDFKFHIVFVAAPSGNAEAMGKRLSAAATSTDPKALTGFSYDVATAPSALAQLRQVVKLPLFLGGFLALLAVGAVGHALATAVRRRRHDIAVLRACGMTRRQSRWAVVVQATVLAVFGLLFGVPLGFALGRTLWRVVADFTPVQYVPPLALWVLVLIVPVSLLLANALAAWPGQLAARLRVAHVLRAE